MDRQTEGDLSSSLKEILFTNENKMIFMMVQLRDLFTITAVSTALLQDKMS